MPTKTRSLILTCLLFACANTALAWSEKDVETGANNHPLILAQQGGEIRNQPLVEYVRSVANRVISATNLQNEPWTITVTDTPAVNAFASPGGYIYVTRGLMAVANDEAELASVISHEIAHLASAHHTEREERDNRAGLGVLIGTVLGGIFGGEDGLKKGNEFSSKVAKGYVGSFSQQQEFEADEIGTKYLADAGYDPFAQSTFLAGLAAKKTFETERTGEDYNPNRVDLFASHPATADRIRKADEIARAIETDVTYRGETEYMARIEGMIYGDSAYQGFVRGKTFYHPVLGFKYSVPDTFTIKNSSQRVVATGPLKSRFILDSGGRAQGDPSDYIKHVWVKQIEREAEVGTLSDIRTVEADGFRAAFATLPFVSGEENWVGQLTLIQYGDGFIRLSGMAPEGATSVINDLAEAAQSFTILSASEKEALKPFRLAPYIVQPDDTLDDILNLDAAPEFSKELLFALNGLKEGQALVPGDILKIVHE